MKEYGEQIPFAKDYFITMEGKITSLKGEHPKEMRIYKEKTGYFAVSLRHNGRYTRKRVHQILAIVFLPNPLGYSEINHIDGDKSNNALNNLEWCDRTHNIRHSFSTGLCVRPKGEKSHMYGANNRFSKLIFNCETGIYYDSVKEGATANGLCHSTLKAYLNGNRENRSSFINA